MGKKTPTSISIDSRVKQDATEVFEALGLTFTSGIEIYLRAVVRERRIPFEMGLENAVRKQTKDD